MCTAGSERVRSSLNAADGTKQSRRSASQQPSPTRLMTPLGQTRTLAEIRDKSASPQERPFHSQHYANPTRGYDVSDKTIGASGTAQISIFEHAYILRCQ